MVNKSDGGAAFPVPNDANVNGQEGMTLRDYFAAQAMPVLVDEFFRGLRSAEYGCPEGWKVGVALDCYAMADAMIEARMPPNA